MHQHLCICLFSVLCIYTEAIPACFSSTGLVKKSHLTSGTLPNRLLAFPLVSVCHRICQSACTLLTESSAVDHLAAALTFQTNQRIIGKDKRSSRTQYLICLIVTSHASAT